LELSQDIPSFDPADQGDEENWDMVEGATERSLSPAPTIEEVVPESAQQATVADELRGSTEERRPEPSATTRTGEPVVAQAEEEAPVEDGLVDIASILGAPTVTVVWSSL
jgi:predicted secreted protein